MLVKIFPLIPVPYEINVFIKSEETLFFNIDLSYEIESGLDDVGSY